MDGDTDWGFVLFVFLSYSYMICLLLILIDR